MIVKDLIKKLRSVSQDARVYVNDTDEGPMRITGFVVSEEDDKVIIGWPIERNPRNNLCESHSDESEEWEGW